MGDVGLRILKDAANSFEGLNRKSAATMNQVVAIFKCLFKSPCLLPLEEGAALMPAKLPDRHRDPFDRMLVSQAN
jgi:hypothetical protein